MAVPDAGGGGPDRGTRVRVASGRPERPRPENWGLQPFQPGRWGEGHRASTPYHWRAGHLLSVWLG